jgi:hypothetical protein
VGVTACVPVAERVPDQPPLALHEVPSFEVQLKVLVWPSVIDVGVTDSVTVDGGGVDPPPPQPVKARATSSV